MGADLGLYSVTFTNNLDWDYSALEAFQDFRLEAEKRVHNKFFPKVLNRSSSDSSIGQIGCYREPF